MSEATELRVVDLGRFGFSITKVDLVDGQSRSYSEDWVLSADTLEALKQTVAELAAALERPVLSDDTDFPDQFREDWSMFLGTVRKRARRMTDSSEG